MTHIHYFISSACYMYVATLFSRVTREFAKCAPSLAHCKRSRIGQNAVRCVLDKCLATIHGKDQ